MHGVNNLLSYMSIIRSALMGDKTTLKRVNYGFQIRFNTLNQDLRDKHCID